MPDPEKKDEPKSGLSVQTLVISSLSAVLATVIVSQFWEKGTLIFTAMTPIAVAILSETLRKPAEAVTKVAPLVVAPRRYSGGGTAIHEPAAPEESRRALADLEAEPAPGPREDRFGLYEPEKGGGLRGFFADRRVRLGLTTGLVAFFIGAAIVTASELTIGNSVGSSERRTTLLGGSATKDAGSSKDDEKSGEEKSTTSPDPEATATPAPDREAPAATPTPEPEATATPEAEQTPAPEATVAPETTPAPGATPAPAAP